MSLLYSKVADRSPDWSRASSYSIDKFQDSVLQSLAPFNPCVTECLSADCSAHLPYLDEYAQNLVTSIYLVPPIVLLLVLLRTPTGYLVGKMEFIC